MSVKDILKLIPNSVLGDGKPFVAALKKFLLAYSTETEKQIEDIVTNLDTKPEQVIGLTLTEQHSTDANGMPQNNIAVAYDTTNVSDFSAAQVWLSADSGENFNQVGSAGGVKYTITGVKAGATYLVKVVTVDSKGNSSDFAEAPQASITIKGSVLVPAAPKQFILTWDEEGPLWEWLHEDNGYVDFFELRLDTNAGEYSDKLLDRTRAMFSRVNPEVRSGTAYLFVRNIFGTYSEPAVHQFSQPLGTKPATPVLGAILKGVNITLAPLPVGYKEYKLIINGEDFTSKNNVFTYFQFSGQITVKYCFVDDIGEGEYSEEVTADVKQLIGAADIEAGAVGEDQLAENAVTAAKIEANAITADKIKAGVVTADKVAADAITAEKIAADAVTAEAIQAGSIIGEHISAGAVTAEKLAAETITLGGELKVVGGAVTLSDEGLKVANANGSYTMFNADGMNFYDSVGNRFTGIGRFMIGVANHNDYVKFDNAWDITPSIVLVPLELQTSVDGYSTTAVRVICSPTEVSKEGFRVQAYTTLQAGASGVQILNKEIIDKSFNRGEVYAEAVITPPGTATSGSLTVSVSAVGASYSYTTPPAMGDPLTFYSHTFIKATVEFYVNSTLKQNITMEGVDDVIFDAGTFMAGSIFKVKVKGWVYHSTDAAGTPPNARLIVSAKSGSYNVDADTVVATGKVTFIATDGNTSAYTVE